LSFRALYNKVIHLIMALIGKIRNNFWFVLLVLGLALAAFVIMDMVNAGNQGGVGPKQIIGQVAGQDIDYADFQRAEQALYGGSADSYAGKNSAWNYLTEKAIVDNQAEQLGIDVSNSELTELQFGSKLSPVIQQMYRNPQTGQIDMQNLLGVKQALQNGDELNENFELTWEQVQKQVIKTAKQDKINALVSKSIYTPTFLAENVGKRSSQQANFEFVKIPFDYIDDSAVEVSDADITSYIQDNSYNYTNDEETRVVEYTVLDVFPTAADSARVRGDLEEIATQFRSRTTTQEDSSFVLRNEGFYSPFYSAKENLSGAIKDNVENMQVGEVFGPFLDNGATVLNSRSASFADLASEHSEDPGSKTDGGSLGTFEQGKMVPAFNNAAFVDSKTGGLYKVRTQFGVHLIKVENRIFNNRNQKYRIALIRNAVTPSEDTQNAIYEVADQMVTSNRSIADLRAAVEGKADLTIERTVPLKANDFNLTNLGGGETSREIVRWVFDEDTQVGDVSPSIYTYTDPVNYYNNKYVLAAVSSKTAPGLATASDMRDVLDVTVRNMKKGEAIVSKVSGSDLASIASSFNSSVESANNIAFTAGGVTGLGNEPDVLAAVFAQAEGAVSKPILGKNGVYVVKTTSKTEGTAPANVLAQKKTLNNTNRGRVGFSLINALKEKFKATDNRSRFF